MVPVARFRQRVGDPCLADNHTRMKNLLIASLLLAATTTAQTYTVTNFGTPCGATLQGQVMTTPAGSAIHLGVTGAHPGALAFLVIGHPQAAPVPLPGSPCFLLVDPRLVLHTVTTATGSARFGFRIPPVLPITIDFQAVIARHTTHLVAESTNGVRLHGV